MIGDSVREPDLDEQYNPGRSNLIVAWGSRFQQCAVIELLAPSSSELKLSPEGFWKAASKPKEKSGKKRAKPIQPGTFFPRVNFAQLLQPTMAKTCSGALHLAVSSKTKRLFLGRRARDLVAGGLKS